MEVITKGWGMGGGKQERKLVFSGYTVTVLQDEKGHYLLHNQVNVLNTTEPEHLKKGNMVNSMFFSPQLKKKKEPETMSKEHRSHLENQREHCVESK